MEITFTMDQVAEHNSEGDAWIIIEDKVYDISKFSKLHPGGFNIIMTYAGKDATDIFFSFHPEKTLKKFPKLKIGRVEDKDVVKQKKNENQVGDNIPYAENNYYLGAPSAFYKPSHIRLAKEVREFATKNFAQNAQQWEEKMEVPKDIYIKMAEKGYLQGCIGAPWNTEYMGTVLPAGIKAEEWDWHHFKILHEEITRGGGPGLDWGISAGLTIGLPPVLYYGSKQLKDKVANDCLTGKKFICLCITEPQAGSDVANLVTRAELSSDGKHYILNGIKKWITNGIFCDYFTVAVRIGKKQGMAGLSLLLVEKQMKGVTAKRMKCQGMIMSGTTYITFENVLVPVENLIGEKGQGFAYIMSNFNSERLWIITEMVASSRVCFEEAFKFAHIRQTFGKKLIEHPVIRNKLAHMARQIEATNAWCENLCHQMQVQGKIAAAKSIAGPISLCKAQGGITLEYCAREAVQIFGGLGYTKGGMGEKVERIYREVRGLAIPAGSEEIMLDLGIRQAMKYIQDRPKL